MDAKGWDARYGTAELVWTAKANRFLEEEVSGMAPGRALDLAAGEGRNAVWLAKQGWRVLAVDFSSVGLEKAQRLAAEHDVTLDIEVADLEAWTPPAGAFDLVAILYLHLPWDRMQPILERAAEAVAPGGTFLLVGHDRENPARGHGGPPSAEVLYDAEDVRRALADRLVIERGEQVERPVETEAGTKIALDVLVRARRPG